MTETLALIGNVVVVVGALVFATAALGLVRFPDFYTRVSAVGTAGGIGIILVVVGCVLVAPSWRSAVLAVLVIGLHLATSSVGTMTVARSAYLSGTPLQRWGFDELADETERRSRAAGTGVEAGAETRTDTSAEAGADPGHDVDIDADPAPDDASDGGDTAGGSSSGRRQHGDA
ncbi:MAG: cation:proton antiporter [Actinomycetaceae bacterium]